MREDLKVREGVDYDVYAGTRQQLIAAGIVREDQFPPPGRSSVSYIRGKTFRGRCQKDETYLRIITGRRECVVLVGVHPDVAAARKRAEQEEYRAQCAAVLEGRHQAQAEEKAKQARSWLEDMPESAMAFRRVAIERFRFYAKFAIVSAPRMQKHGYSFDEAALDEILLAFDGIVEAIMNAKVVFDQAAHLQRIQELQADIARCDSTARAAVAKVLQPNPALLAGSQS